MKPLKYILFPILFYFLALSNLSLMAYFAVYGISLNIIFILIPLYAFFENPQYKFSYYLAISGGLFLDLTSSWFFGFYAVFFYLLTLAIKFLLKNYFKNPLADYV